MALTPPVDPQPVPAALAIQDEQKYLAAPLTIREEKFCFEYLATGGNGTQAFLRVNPLMTDGSAHVAANRLLRKATVQAKIAELRQELANREVMSLAERRARLTAIGRADQGDIWETLPGGRQRMRPLDEMTPEQRLAIQELTEEEGKYGPRRKVKLYSSVDAIDQLNRMDGVYRQVVEGEVKVRHLLALPREQPTVEEWLRDYRPRLPAVSRPADAGGATVVTSPQSAPPASQAPPGAPISLSGDGIKEGEILRTGEIWWKRSMG